MSTNALEKHKPQEVSAHQSESSDPFLAMIAQHADRPELLDKLVDVRNAELQRRAKVAFRADFAQMQPKLPTIDRNGTIEIRAKDEQTKERTGKVQQKSKFAYWADILAACRPAMLEHGFGISFRTRNADDGKIIVTAILSHRDGHAEETEMIPLQHDSTGSKNPTQAVGSTLSYGQRYAGIMALGIASKESDDNNGGADDEEEVGAITEDQAAQLQTMMQNTGTKADKFCEYLKIDAIPDLRADRFDYAMAALRQKQAQTVRQ